MEEFIRTNRNIKGVLVDKFAEMKWRKREGATVQLNWREGKPIEHLYGIRFSYLKPPPGEKKSHALVFKPYFRNFKL